MTKASKFFLTVLAVLGLALFSAGLALAEEESATTADMPVSASPQTVSATALTETDISTAPAAPALETSAELADEPQALEGVTVAKPTKLPSNFGLWWSNLRENISLALTIDPVKKSEKALKYAEEKVKMADYIAQNSTDEKIQEKAQKMLEKANQYIEKIQARQNDLVNSDNEKAKALLNNLADHLANREQVMERLENGLSADNLQKFQVFNKKVASSTQEFLGNLSENKNMPEAVKEKIKQVKENIMERATARQEFRVQEKELLEKIKSGDTGAKEELKNLREQRNDDMKQIKEEAKEKIQSIKEKIKENRPNKPLWTASSTVPARTRTMTAPASNK